MSASGLGRDLLTPSMCGGGADMSSRQVSHTPPSLATGCEHGPSKVVQLNGTGVGGCSGS